MPRNCEEEIAVWQNRHRRAGHSETIVILIGFISLLAAVVVLSASERAGYGLLLSALFAIIADFCLWTVWIAAVALLKSLVLRRTPFVEVFIVSVLLVSAVLFGAVMVLLAIAVVVGLRQSLG